MKKIGLLIAIYALSLSAFAQDKSEKKATQDTKHVPSICIYDGKEYSEGAQLPVSGVVITCAMRWSNDAQKDLPTWLPDKKAGKQ